MSIDDSIQPTKDTFLAKQISDLVGVGRTDAFFKVYAKATYFSNRIKSFVRN